MKSSKWSAHGNVYLLVEDERLTPELARELASVAATDGVIEILSAEGPEAAIAIWNPDGSRAEMSGNGTRIAARWLAELSGADAVAISVGERRTQARINGDRVEQALGQVEVGPRETVEGIELTTVSVGNPHAVVEGDPADVVRVGPVLERHPRFTEGTNVQVASRRGSDRVVARVWERGVGETRSSGTSAVAVAAALVGDGDVDVEFPGGSLHVRLANGEAFLTGPAVRVD